jgi:hypothetical protein
MADLILEAVHAEKKRRGKESKFDKVLVTLASVKKKLSGITKEEWEAVDDIFRVAELKRDRFGRRKKSTKKLSQKLAKIDEMAEKVETCKKLERQFRIVTLDKRAVRKIPRPKATYENKKVYEQRLAISKNPELAEELFKKEEEKRVAAGGKKRKKPKIIAAAFKPLETITFPLVWSAKLPAKPVQVIRKGYKRFEAKTPEPTVEAGMLLAKHKDKFDHMEVWWVPKDVLVIKEPVDPILVGAIKVPNFDTVYFELCRWVDEGVETGWWAREGY